MNTNEALRSVFDCNVLLQAVANPAGPAGDCLDVVRSGRITLFLSAAILSEFVAVANRPHLVQKFRLSPARVSAFVAELHAISTQIEDVPALFAHPRDAKDSAYVDLAIAANAHVITSRDRHLLALRDPSDPAGALFLAKFGHIEVMTPVELLERLRAGSGEA